MDLITGATGFIGSHLATRLLSRGGKVRVLCRPASAAKLGGDIARQAEIAHGDLTDPASLEASVRGAERVFHCAGHVSDWGTEKDFAAANIGGTRALLESSARHGVRRFVHLSSIAVFGVPSPADFDDLSPYGPGRDPYSRTKIEGEKLALSTRGLPVSVVRPSVVYGRGSAWLEEPVRMARRNRIFLLDGGRGSCHPCYIENLLDAIELAAEKPEAVGQAYIVADDDPITFKEYFDRVSKLAGAGPVRRSIPLPVARAMATAFEAAGRVSRSRRRPLLTHAAIDMVCARSRMSISKIRSELGYAPRYSFEGAMRELASKPEFQLTAH